MRHQRGFTLIEIMIALVIVAILAGIAIPSYQSSVQKSRRSAAKSTLLDMVSKQENLFNDLKRYTYQAKTLGYPDNTFFLNSNGDVSGTQDGQSTYSVTMVQDPANVFNYTITATALGMQLKDKKCRKFIINHQGSKTSEDDAGAASTECW